MMFELNSSDYALIPQSKTLIKQLPSEDEPQFSYLNINYYNIPNLSVMKNIFVKSLNSLIKYYQAGEEGTRNGVDFGEIIALNSMGEYQIRALEEILENDSLINYHLLKECSIFNEDYNEQGGIQRIEICEGLISEDIVATLINRGEDHFYKYFSKVDKVSMPYTAIRIVAQLPTLKPNNVDYLERISLYNSEDYYLRVDEIEQDKNEIPDKEGILARLEDICGYLYEFSEEIANKDIITNMSSYGMYKIISNAINGVYEDLVNNETFIRLDEIQEELGKGESKLETIQVEYTSPNLEEIECDPQKFIHPENPDLPKN